MPNVQKRQKLSEAIPEVDKFKHTSYEAHQYGHETNATLSGVNTYLGATM